MSTSSAQDIEACAIRRRIAEDLAPFFAAVPGVVAVFLGGSVARGWADRWSDVELCVVWSSPPTEDQRRAGLADVAIAHHRAFPEPSAVGALEEEFVYRGIKIDVLHMTANAIDAVVHDVTEAADPTLAKQALIASLLVAIPLHGHEAIEQWRLRCAHYPDALVTAMVTRNLLFGPHDYLTMLAERGDMLLLSDILGRIARSVIGVLSGLNRTYPPSADFKWALRFAATLSVAPPDLPDRLRHILRDDPAPAVAGARRIIDETISLVELHLPGVDTAPIRARVSQRRPV